MEKQHLLPGHEPAPRPSSQRLQWWKARLAFTLAFVFTYLFVTLSHNNAAWLTKDVRPWKQDPEDTSKRPVVSSDGPADFSWDAVVATPYLEYTPCYGGEYGCARLELPMDWWNDTTEEKIGLAVIRKPAKVEITDERYGGAVITNPGGPGGSGISQILISGNSIQSIIDTNSTDEGKFFDIISFDPRGIGMTLPEMRCTSDVKMSQSWELRMLEEGILGSSDAGLGRLWSMARAEGGSCSLPPADGCPDFKKFVTTASVARDMVALIEAHGKWREKEALRASHMVYPDVDAVFPELEYKPGEEKIQYWGFSYGTYLGMTFATMFPDRVGRLVIDGVVDPEDYTKMLWYDNLVDTEKDMDLFYFHCARAGYPTCAIANEHGSTTVKEVKHRAHKIITSLYHDPLPVIGDYPEVITYSDVKNLIFGALYSPVKAFPFVANVLYDIERGNGTTFAKLLRPRHDFTCPSPTDETASSFPNAFRNPSSLSLSANAGPIIACTDGDDQSHLTKKDFEKHLEKEIKLSPSIGAMWASIRMSCVHFSIRAHHRFTGPWEGKTSHPLLLIGNTADPVTPVGNAIKVAEGFEGAVALVQDSPGHCSSSAASKCTTEYVRRYFQTGELPPSNTTCGVDEVPFGKDNEDLKVLKEDDLAFRRDVADVHAGIYAGGSIGRFGIAWDDLNAWYE